MSQYQRFDGSAQSCPRSTAADITVVLFDFSVFRVSHFSYTNQANDTAFVK